MIKPECNVCKFHLYTTLTLLPYEHYYSLNFLLKKKTKYIQKDPNKFLMVIYNIHQVQSCLLKLQNCSMSSSKKAHKQVLISVHRKHSKLELLLGLKVNTCQYLVNSHQGDTKYQNFLSHQCLMSQLIQLGSGGLAVIQTALRVLGFPISLTFPNIYRIRKRNDHF